VEIAKFAGFNSPQLAALGLNLSFTDTPWLAAGKFISLRKRWIQNKKGGELFDPRSGIRETIITLFRLNYSALKNSHNRVG
jgi:hypothetical protein